MISDILYVAWFICICGALATAFSIRNLSKKGIKYYTKKELDKRMIVCALFNVSAIVLLIVRTVIS